MTWATIPTAQSRAEARNTISFFSEATIATTDERRTGTVETPRDVAPAIAACWHPPHEGDEVTIRMSFRRDGSIFGRPLITYLHAREGSGGEPALARSIYAAVAACTPLPFSAGLGAAIAGRVFLMRFIAPRAEQRA